MASYVNKIVDTYNYIFTDLADPRTNHLFLISSPWPIICITGLYLYFCNSFGPRYMKDRPPYNLKNIVLVYNVFQVCISTYLCFEGALYISSSKFDFRCDPVDYSDDPRAVRLALVGWWYFLNKIIEFMDTVFFVLRKKNNQITFLHLYHHSMMAATMWLGAKYFSGGHAVVMGTLNAFVHIVMYTYYLISGLGPQYHKYVWWKKHVTTLQLVQFVIILIHNVYGLFNTECTYPKFNHASMIVNALLFINLFGKFFIASYIKPKAKNGSLKNGQPTNGMVKNGIEKNDLTKNGTVSEEIVKNDSDLNGFAKNGSATNGVPNNSSITNGSTKVYENGLEKKCKLHVSGKYKDE